MKLYLPIFATVLSALSHFAGAWTVTADFEGGTVGEIATGPDALTTNAAEATYSSRHVYSGELALSAQVWEGGTAFGGAINFPEPLSEGDEVWYRARWYFPSSWEFTVTSGMKLMRIAGKRQGGDWWDIYIDKDTGQVEPHTDLGAAKKAFNNYKFNDSPLITGPRGQHGLPVKIEAWNTYEIYVKFSADPADSIVRIWQEGNLVFECAGVVPTLATNTNKPDRALIGNYFNGSGPKTQAAFVDSVVITSTRPENRDDSGNPYIGMADVVALDQQPVAAPPTPPQLQVQ